MNKLKQWVQGGILIFLLLFTAPAYGMELYGDSLLAQYDHPYAINNAVSGATTEDLLKIVNTLKENNGHIAVVLIGTNDVTKGRTQQEIWRDIRLIWLTLKSLGYEVWAVTIPPRTDRDDNIIKHINFEIVRSDIPDRIIDIYPLLWNKKGMLQRDGLHLTGKAYRLFTEEMKK